MSTGKHQSVLKLLFLTFYGFADPRGGKVHFASLRLLIRPAKSRDPDVLLRIAATDPRREKRFWGGADLALEVVSEGWKSQRLRAHGARAVSVTG